MNIDLDNALRAYADPPVPLGIEARVISRIRQRTQQRRALGATLAIAACCTLALIVPRHPETANRGARASALPPSFRSAYPVPTPRPEHRPKFKPKPQPDTIDALWRYAQEHPEETIQLTAVHEPEPVAPLQFDPIVIQELENTPK
jgi:hypothetical protein